MLPNFIIIGAQKSASTFLQVCLNDHPDIYMPQEETPFFQSPDYEQSSIRDLDKSFCGRSEKCLGIKRPDYIGRPEVPKRIATDLPDAKLIAVLRTPIDRAVSAYYHNMKGGFIPLMDVEIGMRKLISEPSFSEQYRRSPEIIEYGYYFKYLSKYENYWQKGHLLILLHEDIVSNPLKAIQKAYDFLGVSSAFVPKSLNSRPKKMRYNLKRLKFLTLRNRFLFVYNQDRTRSFYKKMTLIDKAVAGAITVIDRGVISRILADSRPEIGSELRRILYEIYASDIESLEGFLGRDLSSWRPR